MPNDVFSEKQKQEFLQAFNLYDKSSDQKIGQEELSSIVKNMSNHLTKEELKQMIIEADEDGNGVIDFDEFLSLMQQRL